MKNKYLIMVLLTIIDISASYCSDESTESFCPEIYRAFGECNSNTCHNDRIYEGHILSADK